MSVVERSVHLNSPNAPWDCSTVISNESVWSICLPCQGILNNIMLINRHRFVYLQEKDNPNKMSVTNNACKTQEKALCSTAALLVLRNPSKHVYLLPGCYFEFKFSYITINVTYCFE